MHFARISLPALFVLGLAACSSSSSSPSGPVIDDLQMNDTATVGTVTLNGQQVTGYDLKGTVSFHDDTETVNSFTLHLDIPGAVINDKTLDVPPTKQGTAIPFDLVLDQSAPKGPIDVTVTLNGASGAKSSPVKKSVTLQ